MFKKKIERQAPSIKLEIQQVVCGEKYSLILFRGGRVFGMGSNQAWQLGLPEQSNYFIPTEILNLDQDNPICYLSVGSKHSLLLSEDRTTVSVAGCNLYKQLQFKDDLPECIPLKRIKYTAEIRQIIAADSTTAILGLQNRICGFGLQNLRPHLLVNNKLVLLSDEVTKFEALQPIDIACGQNHALLLTATGDVYGIGSNVNGLLGLGDKSHCDDWTKLPLPPVTCIKVTDFGSLVLTKNQILMVSGSNLYKQFSGSDSKKIILKFTPLATEVSTFDASDAHTLYVANNQLFALGCNDQGQLGLGKLNGKTLPFEVLNPLFLAKPVMEYKCTNNNI